jgi:hypothetical protein
LLLGPGILAPFEKGQTLFGDGNLVLLVPLGAGWGSFGALLTRLSNCSSL